MPILTHVDGKQAAQILIYALSTCGWCRKTKALLKELGIAYDYIDVDTLEGEDRELVMEDIRKCNPRTSFPTIVVDGKDCIIGFDPEKIKEAVGA